MTHIQTANLGFPRIGQRRELKTALESFWSGKSDEAALLRSASALRAANWQRQATAGIDVIPSGDFSLYDHLLDAAFMVGAIPARFGEDAHLATYFRMARGKGAERGECGHDHGETTALEMTKWFNTNYHVLLPEIGPDQVFTLRHNKPLADFIEAKALGLHTRPVLVGPVTLLSLARTEDGFDALSLLPKLLPVYVEALRALAAAGADWVQLDEPVLALELDGRKRWALDLACKTFARDVPDVKLMLTSYFDTRLPNLRAAFDLPVAGVHVDLVSRPELLPRLPELAKGKLLSLGIIDGRNIWKTDLTALLDRLEPVVAQLDQVILAPSCSLLHVPIDLEAEEKLDGDLRQWLSFAAQKLVELNVLKRALSEGRDHVATELADNAAALAARRTSARIHNRQVAARVAAISAPLLERQSPFTERQQKQAARLNLPLLPTTTIGSFPQTAEVRRARLQHGRGELDATAYEAFLKTETEKAIRWQEEIDLDVLVHGEFERNDMVQYFAEQLDGYAFTQHGWVQSYGSRYVRPPVLYGDVSRPKAMTVGWASYAQSLTDKPVKGMLTGPVTMLQWAFVRDDIPRETVCRQVALAIRDEVLDLEAAGIRIIQIDEAAFREGMPLDAQDAADYLRWAVEGFRLASAGAADETQIHSHMCYSEFNDIIEAIADMDADVISIETSRSQMALLDAFVSFAYPNQIGPGVYDIHSPRVPSEAEMAGLLRAALKSLKARQLWVNPDCGLKTRGWDETRPALERMVAAAKRLRAELAVEA
ncbi:5-methyltetrahydropteroyltriglutamate--homocysteine S-methyltransferase [Asticcacaulis sp. EMRT-3]|uniref:5-methyltetrahydropteroyltriglutamate-- homocysteine S-methyltransferase n=1 Tax=Asticcacaulis sp. EMRT-3 TaxID=3040349 RepID=UPI0024AFEEFF|nr:5-methyltetrahydropteroyltriglutamate--homocysteine S-methyltransferase [Asticcacaulis sp. EMRT-3]MDI7773822.1 5-methyltetrahydropteroyltriglutamate--homocysteine S-methyltransferase [Asticcacaulis sp. EMRT-3]